MPSFDIGWMSPRMYVEISPLAGYNRNNGNFGANEVLATFAKDFRCLRGTFRF